MLVNEIFGLGRDILKTIFPDKTERERAEAKLEELRLNGQLQLLAERSKIAQAEASSSDKWTSRARPSFMYVFYIIVSFLVIIGPLVGVFFPKEMGQFYTNVAAGFEAIPGAMWGTFTAGYLGYSCARTYEKGKHVAK